MKPMHDFPVSLAKVDTDRPLPPGAGLLIAMGVSVVFWGGIALAFFR